MAELKEGVGGSGAAAALALQPSSSAQPTKLVRDRIAAPDCSRHAMGNVYELRGVSADQPVTYTVRASAICTSAQSWSERRRFDIPRPVARQPVGAERRRQRVDIRGATLREGGVSVAPGDQVPCFVLDRVGARLTPEPTKGPE